MVAGSSPVGCPQFKMDIKTRRYYEDEEMVSSYDEVYIVLNRLEAQLLSNHLDGIGTKKTEELAMEFREKLKKSIELPKCLQ